VKYGYKIPQDFTKEIQEQVELEIKLFRPIWSACTNELERLRKAENFASPPDIDYYKIESLAWEARDKLSLIRPLNIAQAMRIPGVILHG